MTTVRVILFAVIRDLIGKDEVMMSLPDNSDVAAAIKGFAAQYPQTKVWKRSCSCCGE